MTMVRARPGVLGSAALIRAGVPGWYQFRSIRLVGGVLALWVAWLAVAQARAQSGSTSAVRAGPGLGG